MFALLLAAALAAGPHASLDLNIAGGRRATASGILAWDSACSSEATCTAELAVTKPAGEMVTWSSSATTCVQSATGPTFDLPANVPCVDASGAQICDTAMASNGFVGSDSLAGWSKDATVTISVADAACPLAPDGVTRMTLVTTLLDNNGVWLDAASTPCRGTWLARASADADCTVGLADVAVTHTTTASLTAAPARTVAYYAGEQGISLYRSGTCTRWCQWRATGQNTSACTVTNPAPATAGAPYVGSATVASIASTLGLTGCFGGRVTPTGAWSVGGGTASFGLFARGNYGAANTTAMYALPTGSGGVLALETYDAASGYRTRSQTAAFSGAGQKDIAACQDGAGALSIYAGDAHGGLVEVPMGSTSGAGTGLLSSAPASLSLGRMSGYQGNWHIECACEGKNVAAMRDCFRRCQ